MSWLYTDRFFVARKTRGSSVAPVIAPLADLFIALRFFSRMPVPATARERELGASGLAHAVALVPLAGAIIGVCPAVILLAADALALPPPVSGVLAVAALVAVTGALHEDALADCADGFGGGATVERKLEIMRDSRIGAYGACALALSLFVRAVALSAIAQRSVSLGAGTIIAAASLSRTVSLLPLALLPPARCDGVGASAAHPFRSALAFAGLLVVGISIVALAPFVGAGRIVATLSLSTLAVLGFCIVARRQIGGHTGDVAGAAQQLAEIAVYLVLAAG